MFVEKLTYEQKCDIAEKICRFFGKSVRKYQVNRHRINNEPYLEIFIYDYERGNYAICVFDTFVCCAYKAYIKGLKEISEICAKELYKIFGEEYKDYYMKQVNSIFE